MKAADTVGHLLIACSTWCFFALVSALSLPCLLLVQVAAGLFVSGLLLQKFSIVGLTYFMFLAAFIVPKVRCSSRLC